jgi:hypothetical protein
MCSGCNECIAKQLRRLTLFICFIIWVLHSTSICTEAPNSVDWHRPRALAPKPSTVSLFTINHVSRRTSGSGNPQYYINLTRIFSWNVSLFSWFEPFDQIDNRNRVETPLQGSIVFFVFYTTILHTYFWRTPIWCKFLFICIVNWWNSREISVFISTITSLVF